MLRDAERELAALEQRRTRLVDDLAASTSDREALAQIGTALAAIDAELRAAEDRWLKLADESDRT